MTTADTNGVDRFLQLAASPEPFPVNDFNKRRIDLFRDVFAALAALPAEEGRDEAVCDRIVTTLFSARRIHDIAALHAAVKHRHDGRATRDLRETLRRILGRHVRTLFTASLTYHSSEIDLLFCETLGNDRERMLELLGHLFKERRLYQLRLSPQMQQLFFSLADDNPRQFVQYADPHVLAFYLSALHTLEPITTGHLEKWIALFLSPSTNRVLSDKILNALEIHPAPAFLSAGILLSRDEQRGIALTLLRRMLEQRIDALAPHREALASFLMRALAAHFYDPHRIPQEQKVTLSRLILFCDHGPLYDRAQELIGEPNPAGDAKQSETKKILVALLGRAGERYPARVAFLRSLLRAESSIEASVKQEVLRIVKLRPADKTPPNAVPVTAFPSDALDDEKTLIMQRPQEPKEPAEEPEEREEKTEIVPRP